jgi:uncharacterized protein (DUF488 family)
VLELDLTIEVLTIGHSTLEYERFLALLRNAGVSAIADVRSAPYSRHFPHFSRENLKEELRRDGIAYVFLGAELGGRPGSPEFYCDGAADYEKMADEKNFKSGIDRVLSGAERYRIALMCSEHNPLDCHRCLLVGRALAERGVVVSHILSNGKTIPHPQIEEQLIKECGHGGKDFFAQGKDRLADAYRACP